LGSIGVTSCARLRAGKAFVTVVFVAVPTSLSLADASSLPYSEGGYVPDFVKIVRQYNESGEPFRIEDTCKSACTLFLGIRSVCVERGAKLMFHAGHDIAENRTGPIPVRAARPSIVITNACGAICSMGTSWTLTRFTLFAAVRNPHGLGNYARPGASCGRAARCDR
jgi:hypothetical protein